MIQEMNEQEEIKKTEKLTKMTGKNDEKRISEYYKGINVNETESNSETTSLRMKTEYQWH